MSQKEAKARIKINKLLELVGWRFFVGRGWGVGVEWKRPL